MHATHPPVVVSGTAVAPQRGHGMPEEAASVGEHTVQFAPVQGGVHPTHWHAVRAALTTAEVARIAHDVATEHSAHTSAAEPPVAS